jgi:hypothetical protein
LLLRRVDSELDLNPIALICGVVVIPSVLPHIDRDAVVQDLLLISVERQDLLQRDALVFYTLVDGGLTGDQNHCLALTEELDSAYFHVQNRSEGRNVQDVDKVIQVGEVIIFMHDTPMEDLPLL